MSWNVGVQVLGLERTAFVATVYIFERGPSSVSTHGRDEPDCYTYPSARDRWHSDRAASAVLAKGKAEWS